MTSRRLALSMCAVTAGVLTLSGCGGDKSSGLASFKPSSHSPSPSSTSTWTPEQQQVIDANKTYRGLVAKYRRGAKVDRVLLRSVATEQRAVQAEKAIVGGLALGFILSSDDDVEEIRAVTITGAKSTLTECWIGRSYGVNKSASPPITAKPSTPHMVSVNLTRSAGTWRVAGFTDGAACAAKG
jgi:hypothetical protein